MANKADKWAPNAAGKFYVDQQCIDCDLCRETAPGFFTRHDEGGYSYVHKQPTTEHWKAARLRPLATTARNKSAGKFLRRSWTPVFAPGFLFGVPEPLVKLGRTISEQQTCFCEGGC